MLDKHKACFARFSKISYSCWLWFKSIPSPKTFLQKTYQKCISQYQSTNIRRFKMLNYPDEQGWLQLSGKIRRKENFTLKHWNLSGDAHLSTSWKQHVWMLIGQWTTQIQDICSFTRFETTKVLNFGDSDRALSFTTNTTPSKIWWDDWKDAILISNMN
jgi:hypothetical protein